MTKIAYFHLGNIAKVRLMLSMSGSCLYLIQIRHCFLAYQNQQRANYKLFKIALPEYYLKPENLIISPLFSFHYTGSLSMLEQISRFCFLFIKYYTDSHHPIYHLQLLLVYLPGLHNPIMPVSFPFLLVLNNQQVAEPFHTKPFFSGIVFPHKSVKPAQSILLKANSKHTSFNLRFTSPTFSPKYYTIFILSLTKPVPSLLSQHKRYKTLTDQKRRSVGYEH